MGHLWADFRPDCLATIHADLFFADDSLRGVGPQDIVHSKCSFRILIAMIHDL